MIFGVAHHYFTLGTRIGIMGLSNRQNGNYPSFVSQLVKEAAIDTVRLYVKKDRKKKHAGELTFGKSPLVPSRYCGEHELTVESRLTEPSTVDLTTGTSVLLFDSGTDAIRKFQLKS